MITSIVFLLMALIRYRFNGIGKLNRKSLNAKKIIIARVRKTVPPVHGEAFEKRPPSSVKPFFLGVLLLIPIDLQEFFLKGTCNGNAFLVDANMALCCVPWLIWLLYLLRQMKALYILENDPKDPVNAWFRSMERPSSGIREHL